VPRRGLRREDAARYVGISTTKFDECVKDGRMPKPFRIDARVIWDLRRLDAAIDPLNEPVEVDTWIDFE
jgi:predicted DNA-binding transcriptional regulator AlpA